MVGPGGIMSDIYNDKSVRVAPVDIKEAKEMINEVKSLTLIRGYRGLPQANIQTLANAIVSMSNLAMIKNVKEAEINPLLIKEGKEGVVAVDGLIVLNWYFHNNFTKYIYFPLKKLLNVNVRNMSFKWLIFMA